MSRNTRKSIAKCSQVQAAKKNPEPGNISLFPGDRPSEPGNNVPRLQNFSNLGTMFPGDRVLPEFSASLKWVFTVTYQKNISDGINPAPQLSEIWYLIAIMPPGHLKEMLRELYNHQIEGQSRLTKTKSMMKNYKYNWPSPESGSCLTAPKIVHYSY